MSIGDTVQSEAAAAVKLGAGLLTHWQALAFAILALLCGLSAGALYFYEAGDKAASIRYEKLIAEANARAQADHAAMQQQLDAAAASSNPALAKKFDAISAQLAQLTAIAKKPPAVFKPDCVMPKAEQDAYNAIR